MKIWSYVPVEGPGVTAAWILQKQPDMTAHLKDVVEALRWAERDGKITRHGNYYWRQRRA